MIIIDVCLESEVLLRSRLEVAKCFLGLAVNYWWLASVVLWPRGYCLDRPCLILDIMASYWDLLPCLSLPLQSSDPWSWIRDDTSSPRYSFILVYFFIKNEIEPAWRINNVTEAGISEKKVEITHLFVSCIELISTLLIAIVFIVFLHQQFRTYHCAMSNSHINNLYWFPGNQAIWSSIESLVSHHEFWHMILDSHSQRYDNQICFELSNNIF